MRRQNGGKIRVAFGGKHREAVAKGKKDQASDPLLQAQTQGRRQRAIEDRDAAWDSAEEYCFGHA